MVSTKKKKSLEKKNKNKPAGSKNKNKTKIPPEKNRKKVGIDQNEYVLGNLHSTGVFVFDVSRKERTDKLAFGSS